MISEDSNVYSNILYLVGILGSFLMAYFFQKLTPNKIKIAQIFKSFLIASPMSIVLGLRSISVGYDTYMYSHYFFGKLEALPKTEFLFSQSMVLLNRMFGSDNYTIMLLFFSYATVFFAFYAIEKFNTNNSRAVYVLSYCLIFGLCITDQFRQLLGCSLFLMAIAYFSNEKRIRGIIYVIIGTFTHSTVLVVALVYLVCGLIEKSEFGNVRVQFSKENSMGFTLNPKALIFFGFVVVVLFLFFTSSSFLDFLINIVPINYTQYFTTRLNQESVGLGLVLDSMVIIPMIFLHKYCITHHERTIFLFGLFVPVFRLCGYMSYFLYRMLYYPELAVLMLYGVLLRRQGVPCYMKVIVVLICALFYYINYMYLNNHGAFPYEFYFEKRG